MPRLDKRAISRHLTTGCRKQLRLDLSPPNDTNYRAERQQQGMPDPQNPRPGITHLRQVGQDYEIEKYADLRDAYVNSGAFIAIQNPRPDPTGRGRTSYQEQALDSALSQAVAGRFLIEAQYQVTNAFKTAIGIDSYDSLFNLEYSKLRPDIIQVLPAMSHQRGVAPDGNTFLLPPNDNRLQLRIIDIKHTSEPSAGYFAEVAYYMMTIAGWLAENGWDDRFVVVAGGVWPGSHDASNLRKTYQSAVAQGRFPSATELGLALDEDIEPLEFSVFSLRIRRFLQEDLKEVLQTPWQQLPFHVRTTCEHCEYLGHMWTSTTVIDPNHCKPIEARSGGLSQVPQLSPGACRELEDAGVTNIADLAAVAPSSPVLDNHHTLRAHRVLMPARAQALQQNIATIPTGTGTSSVMPKWSDLSIYVSTDFDVSSGITVAFGIKADWKEPSPFGQTGTRRQSWPTFRPNSPKAQVFPVDTRDPLAERRELIAFLGRIQDILEEVDRLDQASPFNTPAKQMKSSMQVYIWDTLQYKHLQRVIGRHLPAILANPRIADLPWLFPPETVLPSYQLQRPSPVTIVQEAVSALAALPVAHYYSLLSSVRVYHRASTDPKWFNVHPLFEGALSDQIPSERAHEIWTRSTAPHWRDQLDTYSETVAKKLNALQEVTWTLQGDIRFSLQEEAPPLTMGAARPAGRMSFDGELWYAFSKLNASMEETEVLAIRAMPSYEREARFHSALLTQQLLGGAEVAALQTLGLTARPGRRVYELAPGSRAAKIAVGDFDLALAPNMEATFLNEKCKRFFRVAPVLEALVQWHWRMDEVTSVTVRGLDRERGLIALDVNIKGGVDFVSAIERGGWADFSRNVSLDPVHRDFFTRKLGECLKSIGNPPIAAPDPSVLMAIGQGNRRGGRQSPHSPAADFLWDAKAMDTAPAQAPAGAPFGVQGSPSLDDVKAELMRQGVSLTDTQWAAWRLALETRLQVIWGPPGTGKSRTLRAIIMGAFEAAKLAGVPLRVLVSAVTYQALDIVLLDTYEALRQMLPVGTLRAARLRSKWKEQPDTPLALLIDLPVNPEMPSQEAQDLLAYLSDNKGLTLVGATPAQIHNLAQLSGSPQAELFDLLIIDEASQMDVAHAVMPLCTLAPGASVVLAGDPKQLPPIHQAEAPLGLEWRVGSIYRYMAEGQGVSEAMLDRNYRSNETLVNFAKEAGYGRALTSHSPDLKLVLSAPSALPAVPSTNGAAQAPAGWPSTLHWTPLWAEMMDPDKPAVCFVYPDGRSSQWNDFEVEAVAALIQTVHGRVIDGLSGELDAAGNIRPTGTLPYTPTDFWKRGIGVVTPHRAQQSRIVTRLQNLFGSGVGDAAIIRDAVDTVEKFQGQQRDIIIASYALGDPDTIQDEEEFLMSLNRFNVMASRARAKLIVLVSREVIDYLANDLEVLRQSALLKVYAEQFCGNSRQVQLGYLTPQGNFVPRPGLLRYR